MPLPLLPAERAGQAPGHPAMDGFHPAVAEWFRRRFPDGPTEPQREGWPHVAAGHDTLIAAPTGSGKTLAAFLVCIDRCYRAHERGEPVERVAHVVYVSPLKALAVDIAENLERPLAEIAEIAAELGLAAPRVRVAVRTGDTTSSRARGDAAHAAELRRHHPGVALPARHQREEPRGPAYRRDRHRRRDPRRRARQARRAPGADARTARSALRHPPRADRALGDATADRDGGPAPRGRSPAARDRRRRPPARPRPRAGASRGRARGRHVGGADGRRARPHRRARARAPHHARVRQHPPARRAARAPARRAPG